jgi:phage shock protein E
LSLDPFHGMLAIMNSPIVSGLVLVGLFVLVYGGSFLAARKRKEATRILQTEKDVLIVDVRTAAEYKESHASGAINVPVESIRKAEKKLGAKTRPVVVYCASGSRSRVAVAGIKRLGFKRVYNMGTLSHVNRALGE